MAQFGAKRPRWAPVKTEPESALPEYDYEKAVTLGKLVRADLTVTNASGELYADDALAEKVDMFASGSLALDTDDMIAEVYVPVFGATKDEGGDTGAVTDKDSDVAPRGGIVYYKVLIRNGIRIYQGVFLPLVKAILGNDTAATKGNSITFGTTSTTFTVFRCNSGAWRIRKEFTGETAEAECIKWCEKKLGQMPEASAAAPDNSALLGKQLSDFSDDLAFSEDGENIKATGELKYITEYSGFSKTAELKEGYYLPFKLTPKAGAGTVGVTLNGAEVTKGELTDPDNVFIVRLGKDEATAKRKSISVRVDDKTFSLDYSSVKYEAKD